MLIESHPWLSIIPPVLAIGLAIKTRQVYLSLFAGIMSGTIILADGQIFKGIADSVEACVQVFGDAGNTRVIIFSAMVGALIALLQKSGGIDGFNRLAAERGIVKDRRSAQLFAFFIPFFLFIESSIVILVTGTVSRPLTDKYKISREKLAYICDSTSAPICAMIPINAWGAYVTKLLDNEGLPDTITLFLSSVFLNFYAITTLLFLFIIILLQFDFGPMKKAEDRARNEGKVLRDGAKPAIAEEITKIVPEKNTPLRARNMVIPIFVMIATMFAGLYITGGGNLKNGSGSTSVLWAVITAIVTAGILYRAQKIINLNEFMDLFFKGLGGLIGLAILMMMAFAIGNICREMKTGIYLAEFTKDTLSPVIFPALIFVITGLTAFSTGTSWGTWGIMFPIAIPMALSMGLSLPPVIGALLGGGVFGDHCSPISDTTIVSSMASASDHIDHVRTQLPYAISMGVVTVLLLIITGFIAYT